MLIYAFRLKDFSPIKISHKISEQENLGLETHRFKSFPEF